METKRITTSQEFESMIQNGVALIDFNAPWCGPCRTQEPIVRELADQYKGEALIAEMNVDENQETASKLGIKSIPTLALFKNGKEIQRFVGLQSYTTLSNSIEDLIR